MRINYYLYDTLDVKAARLTQIRQTVNNLVYQNIEVTLVLPFQVDDNRHGFDPRVNIVSLSKTAYYLRGWFGLMRYYCSAIQYMKQNHEATSWIYFRHTSLLLMMAYACARKYGCIIYEAHRLVQHGLGRISESYLWNHQAALVTISDSLLTLYRQRYPALQAHNSIAIHDGVDLRLFSSHDSGEARNRLGIDPAAKLVMYVGSLWLIKGVDVLVAAARMRPDIQWYLIGRQMPDFVAWLHSQQLTDNLHIVSEVRHREVPTYLQGADILVIPHPDNQRSQSPLKAFEYLASGKYIIASNAPSLREIMPSTVGWFEPGKSDGLVAAVDDYWHNKEHYDTVAQGNISYVRKFTWDARARAIRDFILSL